MIYKGALFRFLRLIAYPFRCQILNRRLQPYQIYVQAPRAVLPSDFPAVYRPSAIFPPLWSHMPVYCVKMVRFVTSD